MVQWLAPLTRECKTRECSRDCCLGSIPPAGGFFIEQSLPMSVPFGKVLYPHYRVLSEMDVKPRRSPRPRSQVRFRTESSRDCVFESPEIKNKYDLAMAR